METELFINSSDRTQSVITLKIGEKQETLTIETPIDSGSVILNAINTLLSKFSLSIKEVTHLHVAIGPGSYTGLRVGIAIASMMGVLLAIPVNGQNPGTPITPFYEGDMFASL